jgi:G3E family GTPase
MGEMDLIPTTILTGFLGSGKSTLLNRVLTEAHGQKIAVIENEFGEENIDSEIIFSGGAEQIIQMNNGCVCCSIRDDLRATLQTLAGRKQKKEINFDRVMIETTGLADPGPVAQTFFLDEEVASHYRLDAILTMVDAKHAMRQLDERHEARRQVGFADHLFISKTDLVAQEEVDVLSHRLGEMNPHAPQKAVHFGKVALCEVFDLGGFCLDAGFDVDPRISGYMGGDEANHDLEKAECERSPSHDFSNHHRDHGHHHPHKDDVKSFVFRTDRPFHPMRFAQFMNAIIISYGARILRYKGVLNMHGSDRKVILQGVHQLLNSDIGLNWNGDGERISKLVFIGIDLPKDLILMNLQKCLI